MSAREDLLFHLTCVCVWDVFECMCVVLLYHSVLVPVYRNFIKHFPQNTQQTIIIEGEYNSCRILFLILYVDNKKKPNPSKIHENSAS